jgi:hypothetical protein
MPQAFGYIWNDGTIYTGSGNFSVTKEGAGVYQVTVTDTNDQNDLYDKGIMTATVHSKSVTANATVEPGDPAVWTVRTGFTDQGGTTYTDLNFSFIAMW